MELEWNWQGLLVADMNSSVFARVVPSKLSTLRLECWLLLFCGLRSREGPSREIAIALHQAYISKIKERRMCDAGRRGFDSCVIM